MGLSILILLVQFLFITILIQKGYVESNLTKMSFLFVFDNLLIFIAESDTFKEANTFSKFSFLSTSKLLNEGVVAHKSI